MNIQDQRGRAAVWLRAVLVGLSGLLAASWAASATAQKKLTILSGYDILFMQGFVADKEGFFKDEGLDVTVKYTVSGKVAVDGVVAGAGVMGISASLVSVTAATRAPIYIIAPLGRSVHYMQMVALGDNSSAVDLKGKRIGFQFGTEGHRFALTYLRKNGIATKDVTLMNIPAQALPAALSRKDIDALSVWPPHSTKALQATKGSKLLEDSKGVLIGFGVVVMRKDFVDSDPDGAQRLLRALLKADEFMNKNPKRTMEHFAAQGKVTMGMTKSIYNDLKPIYSMAIDEEFVNELKLSADFLADHGYTKERGDPREFIYHKLMRDVAPKLVTFKF